jgi:hypothetical protein
MCLLPSRLVSGGLSARSPARLRRSSSHDADAAQMGGEIGNLSAKEQDLLMQRRDETGHRHALIRRYLFEDAPKHLLKAQARALAVEPDRSRLEGVAVRGLICKKVAHVSSIDLIFSIGYSLSWRLSPYPSPLREVGSGHFRREPSCSACARVPSPSLAHAARSAGRICRLDRLPPKVEVARALERKSGRPFDVATLALTGGGCPNTTLHLSWMLAGLVDAGGAPIGADWVETALNVRKGCLG